MNTERNPFAPGADNQPPELAGRDEIISGAEISIRRILAGRYAKPQLFLRLRGTGKTALLNEIKHIAETNSCVASFVELPEDGSLAGFLYPQVRQALGKLSAVHNNKEHEYEAESGTAGSGNLEFDLTDLFVKVGESAKSAKTAWCLLVDELQYLSKKELAALIAALHRVNQKSLPVIFFGAGLPCLSVMAGDAKPYAERMFDFLPVGSLGAEERTG